jgi:transcriptional regulator with XRE-family HTH domain
MYYDANESGKRIHALRKKHGMTQEELAEKIGVNASFLSRVERGTKSCSVDMLVNLSEVFSTTLDYLVLGKNAPETAEVKEEINDIVRKLAELTAKL